VGNLQLWKETISWIIKFRNCRKISSGYRMPKPSDCPEEIYELMTSCWNADPKSRPTFKQLYDSIDRMYKRTFNTPTIPQEIETDNGKKTFTTKN